MAGWGLRSSADAGHARIFPRAFCQWLSLWGAASRILLWPEVSSTPRQGFLYLTVSLPSQTESYIKFLLGLESLNESSGHRTLLSLAPVMMEHLSFIVGSWGAGRRVRGTLGTSRTRGDEGGGPLHETNDECPRGRMGCGQGSLQRP